MVNATGTDSTLLFLQREEGGYRISTPYLSMQPVTVDDATGNRAVVWLNGTSNRKIEGTDTMVYSRANASPEHEVTENLCWYGLDINYVENVAEMYAAVADADRTVPEMVDGCRIIALVEIESASDAYQEDGRWYRDLNAGVETVYKDPDQVLTEKTCMIKAEVGSPNEPAPGKSLYVALLREGDEELFLQENLYNSLLVWEEESDDILWFGIHTHREVNQGLRTLEDLEEYCTGTDK